MKVEYIQPFITSAIRVLKAELGMEATVGELAAERAANTTQEVSVLIGITGEVEGTVIFGTSKLVATEMVTHLTGERRPVFDEVSESAMGELGNVISGGAAMLFEESGIHCTISPPTVIVGRGTIISTVNMKRLLIPLILPFGQIHVAVALRSTVG